MVRMAVSLPRGGNDGSRRLEQVDNGRRQRAFVVGQIPIGQFQYPNRGLGGEQSNRGDDFSPSHRPELVLGMRGRVWMRAFAERRDDHDDGHS